METKKVVKWFWVWQFEEEEAWLNSMAAEGWALYRVGFATYYFEKTEPGEYIIREEFRKRDVGYESFLKEIGAEYIGRMAMWIFFRRKAELGEFELNSDLDSRIQHLSNICRMLLALMLLNLGIGLFNLRVTSLGVINILCAGLLAYCYGRVQGKRDELIRERQLHE